MTLIRYFAFEPESSVARWLAWFAATLAILAVCAYGLGIVTGMMVVLIYAVIGAVVAKFLTESVRRLHSSGQEGLAAMMPLLGVCVLVLAAVLLWIWRGADILFWADCALVVLVTAALMLRPGRDGVSARHDSAAAASVHVGRTGAVVAAALIAGAVLLGFAVVHWQAEIARQTEIRTRIVPVPADAAPAAAMPVVDDAQRKPDPLSNDNAALSNQIDDLLKTDAKP